jgi:hydrogenase assembly chaperone HypC/HupF
MCLSIPYQIKKILGETAVVDSCQKKNRVISLSIMPKVKVGDWILALNGFAIQKITEENASELNSFLKTNKGGAVCKV